MSVGVDSYPKFHHKVQKNKTRISQQYCTYKVILQTFSTTKSYSQTLIRSKFLYYIPDPPANAPPRPDGKMTFKPLRHSVFVFLIVLLAKRQQGGGGHSSFAEAAASADEVVYVTSSYGQLVSSR